MTPTSRAGRPLTDATGPTFGQLIKGARLGYHWSPQLSAMVRVDAEGPPWKVTMCPPAMIPNAGNKGHFLVWWEAADNPLAHSPAVNEAANPRNVVTFSIGENGEKA